MSFTSTSVRYPQALLHTAIEPQWASMLDADGLRDEYVSDLTDLERQESDYIEHVREQACPPAPDPIGVNGYASCTNSAGSSGSHIATGGGGGSHLMVGSGTTAADPTTAAASISSSDVASAAGIVTLPTVASTATGGSSSVAMSSSAMSSSSGTATTAAAGPGSTVRPPPPPPPLPVRGVGGSAGAGSGITTMGGGGTAGTSLLPPLPPGTQASILAGPAIGGPVGPHAPTALQQLLHATPGASSLLSLDAATEEGRPSFWDAYRDRVTAQRHQLRLLRRQRQNDLLRRQQQRQQQQQAEDVASSTTTTTNDAVGARAQPQQQRATSATAGDSFSNTTYTSAVTSPITSAAMAMYSAMDHKRKR